MKMVPNSKLKLKNFLALLFFLSIAGSSALAFSADRTPAQLVQEARSLYQSSQFEEAALLWQQAAEAFAESKVGTGAASRGDILNQVMALSNLSLTYQRIGEWEEAKQAIADSLNLMAGDGWIEVRDSKGKIIYQVAASASPEIKREIKRVLAQVLDIQGWLQRETGGSDEALATWQQATELYEQIEDKERKTQGWINQAQAMQDLGLYPRACETLLAALDISSVNCQNFDKEENRQILLEKLESLLEDSQNQASAPVKVLAAIALGDVLRVAGQLESSQIVLAQSLQAAQELGQFSDLAVIYLSLGNTVRALGETEAALDYYKQSASLSQVAIARVEAQLNQISLLISSDRQSDAEALQQSLWATIKELPLNRKTVDAQINFANNAIDLELIKIIEEEDNLLQSDVSILNSIDTLLVGAGEGAKRLQDKRGEAYAIGLRGRLYELRQQWELAEEFTREALILAPAFNAPHISYQFYWQLGRIHKEKGNMEEAIAHHTKAVKNLQSLRGDLVSSDSQAQFSFRETVEPVYRELVEFLLPPGIEVEQSDLKQARELIESLQLAELDNFFKDACLDVREEQIDQIDPKAAVFYSIVLPDRLEVILALPGQPLRRHTTLQTQAEVEATLKQMRNALTFPRLQLSVKNFWRPSQKVYDWLIRPVEKELEASGVETLVFVLDGALRNVPMSGLYDGDRYLVEKYGIALTPGLQLLDPKPLAGKSLKTLAAGLSEARQGFSPLPGVELELDRIGAEISLEVLLNQSFTESKFQQAVNAVSFPVVHLATHGEFSSKAEDTFILTWEDRINANELDSLLRSDTGEKTPIELLVLSACQTAVGDDRAALGLAGIAVRAGARSTLASLWYVSDAATAKLMANFYQELANSSIPKAEALRRAQQLLLQDSNFSHPYYWSAFVLVGNWL